MLAEPPRSALPLFYFCAYGALGAFLPYFPPWLQAHGFVGLRMSLLMALVPALAAVVPPVVGQIADRTGSRSRLLMAVAAMASLGMLALGLLDAIQLAGQFFWVLLAFAPFVCCRPAIIMMVDRIALEAGGNYGRRRLWGSLGFMVVALAAGQWSTGVHLNRIPWIVGGLLTLAVGLATRLPTHSFPATSGKDSRSEMANRLNLLNPRFGFFLGVTALFQLANISYHLCGSLLFEDLGATGAQTGSLWGVGVVAEVTVMLTFGKWIKRFGPEPLLIFAMAVGAVRWGATASLNSPELAFATQSLHGITFGLTLICSLAYVERHAPPGRLGAAQGLFMMAQSIGGVLGTLLWGPVYESQGGAGVFGWSAAICLLCAALALATLRPVPRSQLHGA